MKCENAKTLKKPTRYAALIVVVGALLGCTAGCHSSDDASSNPTIPQATPQSKAESVSAVQNNPNIPPEAKAHISAQIQGTGPPPLAPTAKHP